MGYKFYNFKKTHISNISVTAIKICVKRAGEGEAMTIDRSKVNTRLGVLRSRIKHNRFRND